MFSAGFIASDAVRFGAIAYARSVEFFSISADNLPEPERDARLAALDSAFARRDLHLFLVELGAGRDPL